MANPAPTTPTKIQTWKRTIAEWKRSGQSVGAFCKARGLKDSQI
jgi:hypothetical protein